ncbi:MAG TPA: aminoglycoside adenylyltransferase domain-containing protein [Chloroflexota bacterium]
MRPLVDDLTARIQGVLGDKLAGLYLWGSYAVGDFDPRISDLDLAAALAADVDEREYAALDAMHDGFARDYPAWAGRIEVRYASVATLNAPADGGEILSISPGESFNRRRSDDRWLIDWYVLRERGITLHGPPPAELLAPIPRERFIASVRANVESSGDWNDYLQTLKRQAYVILAMCRAMYATQHGDQLSKYGAGRWAQRELPEWADLIERAIAWRDAPEDADGAATAAETRRFVDHARRRILG